MIRFLTEDKANSPFVKLFNAAYGSGEEVLYCAGSNTMLIDYASRFAKQGHQVIVFMDIVPDNMELYNVYDKLEQLHSESGFDVVVMPIICAEYAFIESILGIDSAFHSYDGLDLILGKASEYRSINGSVNVPRSFEKLCKMFCARCLGRKCCAVTSNSSALGKPYFSGDCSCDGCNIRLTMKEKAILFISQYPVVPHFDNVDGLPGVVLSWDDVVGRSNLLVDEFNAWIVRSSKVGRKLRKYK